MSGKYHEDLTSPRFSDQDLTAKQSFDNQELRFPHDYRFFADGFTSELPAPINFIVLRQTDTQWVQIGDFIGSQFVMDLEVSVNILLEAKRFQVTQLVNYN